MQRRQILGVLGAVAIAVGVFVPIFRLPGIGNVTYFRGGQGDGIMLALALVALAIALRNKCAWLLPTAFTVLAVMITTVKIARFTLVPSERLAQTRPQTVHIEWGTAVIVVGALLLFASALLKPNAATATGTAEPHLPRNVLVTTFIMAAVFIATIYLWPSGRFILSNQ